MNVAGLQPKIARADVMDISAGLGRVRLKRFAGNRHDTALVVVSEIEVQWVGVSVGQVHGPFLLFCVKHASGQLEGVIDTERMYEDKCLVIRFESVK